MHLISSHNSPVKLVKANKIPEAEKMPIQVAQTLLLNLFKVMIQEL